MRSEIIAEIGQNHNGDMEIAAEMIRQARAGGADVAKFQVYDARALFPKEGNPWFEYNCQTELSRDQVAFLAEECGRCGIEFMASVFDRERVGWMKEIGVKRYKLASRSVGDRDLIEALCATGRPLLVSLGMWEEDAFPEINAAEVGFLYCISRYPTPLEDVRLGQVDFGKFAGFSDHTMGCSAAMAAMARGARIIEKHLTLSTEAYGPDHACSMTPDDLEKICRFRDDLARCI